jgi:hypothetical protein
MPNWSVTWRKNPVITECYFAIFKYCPYCYTEFLATFFLHIYSSSFAEILFAISAVLPAFSWRIAQRNLLVIKNFLCYHKNNGVETPG